MHRVASVLLASLCLLGPRVARAEDNSPLAQIQDWFSKLGKPQAPQPPPQEDLGARNTFTLNPLALQHARLGLEYEHGFGSGFSLFAAPEFAYGSAASSWQMSLGGTLGARFFVLGNAPSGIYFGPEVSVVYQRSFREEVLRKAIGLGLGGGVGWTLVFFNRFTLSAGFSAQYRSVPDLESTDEGAVRIEIVPVPRLAFGVAF